MGCVSDGLVTGQVVTSRRGRDVTKVYMVAGFDGDMVLVCDGKKRTLAQPKKKNIRHLQPTSTVLPEGDTRTDLGIKAALEAYENEREPADVCPQNQGAQQQGG